MKYLGIDNCGGTASIGVFDSETHSFTLKKFDYGGRVLGIIFHGWYKKNPNRLLVYLVRGYASFMLKRLLQRIGIDVDYVVLASNSGSKAILGSLKKIEKRYANKIILKTDHNWGYLNAVTYHPNFKYPALVVDASLHHSIIAYLPSDMKIEIVQRTVPDSNGFEQGLGHYTINLWVELLQEIVYWPDQKKKGAKQVYELYRERGMRGKIVIDMKAEIKETKDIFCGEIFKTIFPKKMEAIKVNYSSLESFKDDWVASQWQLLRDVISNIREVFGGTHAASTCFISGGISFNPALQGIGWLMVPKELAGAQGAGCAMAYLGYSINEKGLKVDHEEWKDYLFA